MSLTATSRSEDDHQDLDSHHVKESNILDIRSGGTLAPPETTGDRTASAMQREGCAPGGDDNTVYPTGARLALLCIALCSSVFIVALSNTIISTAIPTITSVFNSYDDIGWYSSGELITACAFQLPFGRFYALLNTKWTFLGSLIVYLLGSAVCGAAPSSIALIVGRAIAGIGAAGVIGGTFIILARNVPLRKRSLFTGLIGATFAIASVVGPVVGGAFTTKVSWRWCFYINLPFGAVAVAVILFFLPASIGRSSPTLKNLTWWETVKRFDPCGTALLLPAVICLVIALQWGGARYPWSSGRVIAVVVVFAVTFVAWVVLQYFQGDEATVPFSMLKQRTVFAANMYTLFLSASFTILVFYLPIWYQSVEGNNAEESGLKMLAIIFSLTFFSLAAGGATYAIGYYNPFLILGTVLTSVGAGLLCSIDIDVGLGKLMGAQILCGAGIGMSLEQCNIAIQAVLPADKMPMGVSLVIFTRTVAGALAGPIGQAVLQKTLAQRLGQTVASQVYGQGGAVDVRAKLGMIYGDDTPALRSALDGFNDAVTRTFMVAVILAALTAPFALMVEWKSVKKEKREIGDKIEREEQKDEGEKEKVQRTDSPSRDQSV
ncbi:hypothetical protein LTR36_001683 [Oleoguttula mirabilis]|uniref:Major facilitator superfamily (MFS) profile domain-containing protein n=1 Tax=Oleoguttula mirabilis TaxID=1507867 RepID=A0AAV9JPN6_9PEZI|nr:hypothetical protein LTR36_001683 [Oleoguttula mirabilis]